MSTLDARALCVQRGHFEVVADVTLSVAPGTRTALVGRNGAGKSSVLRGLIGLDPIRGALTLGSTDLAPLSLMRRVRAGLRLTTGERAVFPTLGVVDGLRCASRGAAPRDEIDRRIGLLSAAFPLFRERANVATGLLSGGEQRLVAVATMLMARPTHLLVDDPSAGLSLHSQERLIQCLRSEILGPPPALLIAEQNVDFALRLCDRVAVMSGGRIVEWYDSRDLLASPSLLDDVKRLA